MHICPIWKKRKHILSIVLTFVNLFHCVGNILQMCTLIQPDIRQMSKFKLPYCHCVWCLTSPCHLTASTCMQSVWGHVLIPRSHDVINAVCCLSKHWALTSNSICTPSGPSPCLISLLGGRGSAGDWGGCVDKGCKGTGKQMASYLSLLCEGCHSNRLMQGQGKEKKRHRQSRKGLGKTMEPRATGQICRLGHNRWSFFNRQGQLLRVTCAAVPCFKRSHALFTYDSANG